MPQTTPPTIWLRPVLVFKIRPAATALTTRVTRMTPSRSSTFTSAKTGRHRRWHGAARTVEQPGPFDVGVAEAAFACHSVTTSGEFILATPLSEGPQSAALSLIARPEQST